jgi:hypothetical protein
MAKALCSKNRSKLTMSLAALVHFASVFAFLLLSHWVTISIQPLTVQYCDYKYCTLYPGTHICQFEFRIIFYLPFIS